MNKFRICSLRITALAVFVSSPLQGGDWATWGGTGSRNMASSESYQLPDVFDPGEFVPGTGEVDIATTVNCRWAVKLGSQTFSSPTVADGRVYIGTNNGNPRNAMLTDDHGVLMAFDESTGQFLWQLAVPKIGERILDWPEIGICTSPTIVGNRGYLVTNRSEVVCFDTEGIGNGNDGMQEEDVYLAGLYDAFLSDPGSVDRGELYQPGAQDADIIWVYDMRRELGIQAHCVGSSSILYAEEMLFVTTGNGVDESHVNVPAPGAPSLIALDPSNGSLLAKQAPIGGSPDNQILHGSWTSPAFCSVSGRKVVLFGGPDGWLYGLSPEVPVAGSDFAEYWRYDANPPEYRRDGFGDPIPYLRYAGPSEIVSTPVFHNGLVYVLIGQDPEHGEGVGMLSCVDPGGNGDLTGNAVWTFKEINRSLSTPTIHNGLLFVSDYSGFFYCLDALTGAKQWKYDFLANVWSSPLCAKGKIYAGTEDGELYIIDATATLDENEIEMITFPSSVYSTPVATGDTLYVTTRTHLYAFSNTAEPMKVLNVTLNKENGDVRVTVGTEVGKTYAVWRSGDLKTWEIVDPAFPSGGATTDRATYVDPSAVSGSERFYYRFSENP